MVLNYRKLASLAFMAVAVGCGTSGTSATSIEIEVSPSSLDFGMSPGSKTVTITSRGKTPLTVASLTIEGDQAASFQVSQTPTQPLASGEQFELTVTFAPLLPGNHTARLVVESNARNSPEFVMPLLGTLLSANGGTGGGSNATGGGSSATGGGSSATGGGSSATGGGTSATGGGSALLQVSTCDQLEQVPADSNATVELQNDLDCAGKNFMPLKNFRGTLDGKFFVVKNLFIDRSLETGVGLVGNGIGATVQNLGVVNAVVNGQGSVFTGLLLGNLSGGTVRQCFATGAVSNVNYFQGLVNFTGGLLGYASNDSRHVLVEDVFSQAIVHGGNDYSGGLAGAINPTKNPLRRSYAVSPSVTALASTQGSGRTGALLTYTWSALTDCFAVAQPSLGFVQDIFDPTDTNNVALVAGPHNSVADGGVADFQGAGISTSKAPFATAWDFSKVWQETASYPTLQHFTYPANWNQALAYSPSYQHLVANTAIALMKPVVMGAFTITGCTVSPALPAGIVLNPTTCEISGTASASPATTRHTISATTSVGPMLAVVTLLEVAPTVSYPGSPFTFNVLDGAITPIHPVLTGTVSACKVMYSAKLPTGLSLGADCSITGTPTVRTPTTNFSIAAQNVAGEGQTSMSITVVDPLPTLEYVRSTISLTQNVPLVPVVPTTFVNVASVSISPALPAGLALDATTGVISGTPTTQSPTTVYTLTALNAAAQPRTSTLTLSVVAQTSPAFKLTDFDLDGSGAPVGVALWLNGVAAQAFTTAGATTGGVVPLYQTVGSIRRTEIVVSRGTGRYAVLTRFGGWGLALFNADGTLRAGPFNVPTSDDEFGEVAIDGTGAMAAALPSKNGPRLWLYDADGALRPGAPFDMGGCPSSSYGVHLALTSTGAGVMTCQGHSGDTIFFRRFNNTTGAWVDAASVAVTDSSSNSSWYDSHDIGVSASGSFVIEWANYTLKRSEASFFSAAGVLVAHTVFGTNASGQYDTFRDQHVRLQSVGGDFILPYLDDVNGTSPFNTYARYTAAGALKGTAVSPAAIGTLVTGPSAELWLNGSTGLTKNSFTLVP